VLDDMEAGSNEESMKVLFLKDPKLEVDILRRDPAVKDCSLLRVIEKTNEREINTEDGELEALTEATSKLTIITEIQIPSPPKRSILATFEMLFAQLKLDIAHDKIQQRCVDAKQRCDSSWQYLREEIIKIEGHASNLVRPVGHGYLPFHAYLLSPTLTSARHAVSNSILDDGAEATMALKGAGFGKSNVHLADAFPWRTSNRKKNPGEDIRVRSDHPALYRFLLSNHLVKCLEKGGEVTLVFGGEVKEIFKEGCLRVGVLKIERPVSRLSYHGAQIDAEMWMYEEGGGVVRRLMVYVPHPTIIIGDYLENDPVKRHKYARTLDAALEWIASFVPGTQFHRDYWVHAIQKKQPKPSTRLSSLNRGGYYR